MITITYSEEHCVIVVSSEFYFHETDEQLEILGDAILALDELARDIEIVYKKEPEKETNPKVITFKPKGRK